MACRILVPQSGIEPAPSRLKRGVLTTGLPGNSHPTSNKETLLVTTSGLQPGALTVRSRNRQHQHHLELVRNTDSWDPPQTYRLNTLRVGPSNLGFNKPSR